VTTISLIFAISALGYTVYDIGPSTISEKFSQIGWWWLAVIGLEVAITSLDALAMRSFMSPEQDQIRWRDALLAQLAGRAVNAVTPTGNLGEAVKVSVLVEHVSQSRAVATILLYNVVSFMVELMVVVVAAPIMVLLNPWLPDGIKLLVMAAAGVCFIITLALYLAVKGGILVGIARFARRIRLLSQARFERWEVNLRAVDDKLRLVSGARGRDRAIGIVANVLSRCASMTLSAALLTACGVELTVGFFASLMVAGFAIYMVGSLVPMGLGVSEGGNDALFKALHHDAGGGVTAVLARRVTQVMYAAIGLFLVTTNLTVRRARERSLAQKRAAQQADTLGAMPEVGRAASEP
jgi:uncharacterized protein (TIRG00374 family)